MGKIAALRDLEEASKSTTEKAIWDYWQSGANELVTLKENTEAFNKYRVRGRTMFDVSDMDLTAKKPLFGRRYKAPIGIAPSAHHKLAAPAGEMSTASACQKNDLPMALSSYSNCSVEEVNRVAPTSAVFFQLYVFKNRKTTEMLVKRAEKAGFKAILLTSDTPYIGQRHDDFYNNFQLPRDLTLGNFEGLATGQSINVPNPVEEGSRAEHSSDTNANVIDPSLTWDETIPWLKSITKLEIWSKGILTPEDAEAAISSGIDGIWVSNHGGRQLDSTIPTIEALGDVVEAVRGRIPVHLDGGVRRGGDIFKALALGADYVWIGRPALWGLKYNGQSGVELMQEILIRELRTVMALAGTRSTEEISKKCILRYGPRLERL